MRSLLSALEARSLELGVTRGELGVVGTSLVSFCVLARPELPATPCLQTLGFARPVLFRAFTPKRRFQVGNNEPTSQLPVRLQQPRYGAAGIALMDLTPPKAKPKADSPKGVPMWDVDTSLAFEEVCFVDRKIGE